MLLEGPYSNARIIGLIVPANSNLVLSGNSLCLERMSLFRFHFFNVYQVYVSLLFAFFVLISTCFIVFPSCFGGASNMEMFLLLVGLHKVRDGMPQLVGTVPLRIGTGVDALLYCTCVLP